MSQDANKTEMTAAEMLTTDELVAELRNRCDVHVLAYVANGDKVGGYTLRVGGPKIATLGLAHEALRFVRDTIKQSEHS